jgi:hypothetical protein
MRKWVIGAGIAVVAIGLVVGGAAFAASQAAPDTAALGQAAYMAQMGGRMQAFRQGGAGPGGFGGQLHDFVFQALADELNLSVEELEGKVANGQDMAEIAQEQGVAEEDLPSILEAARAGALAAAVEAGVLTQVQADWMTEHPLALRMLGRMRGEWGDRGARGPMGWDRFGAR